MTKRRIVAQQLLDEAEPPAMLWVRHSPATRVMCEDADGPHLDLSGHFDWLLALGRDELGLFRVSGPRLSVDQLEYHSPYGPLDIEIVDNGGLAVARIFTVSATPGPWFAVSAPIHGRRRADVDVFTDILRSRCAEEPVSG